MENLNVSQLSFGYAKDKKIFSDFSLQCYLGEVVLLSGVSGKGKSTLASLLAGHLIPQSGEIRIEGCYIKKPSRKVLVVHQENDLFSWLTVEGHLNFLKNKDLSLELPEIYDFHDELTSFGLINEKEKYPHEISGGMKKRLAVLRSLLLRPRVLIIDEALSSLNKELKKSIMAELKRYIVQHNMLLLLIDHNTEELDRFIDKKVFI